ncbi:ABC transporter ATP-binding protein/permease [Phormidium yuhuli AB48]|uniref:ABC transporter ATP-binding protein/permease n=1 Tax=Phormidium yuhuli AB48 TaxID=2940671 RepID=A0ABY5AVQ4_9CYAN|nr:ABC transporter ATP-binding protein [Phormidium yuhuli]USR92872.1 ABC transporter ATP-binding protein/permease [Phormidium yuhuli AB48]
MQSSKHHPFRRLLDYAQGYRVEIWQACLCSVLNKVFDLAPPALIGLAVDIVVEQENSFLANWGFESVFTQLVVLSLLSFLIWALESIFEYAYERLWRNLAQSIQHDLRLDGYQHLQRMELSFFEERSTGALMAVLNDDINQLERFLDRGANEVLQVLTTVIVIGGAFIVLTPNIAALALLPIPFILWGSISFQKRLAPRYDAVRETVSTLNSQLSNNLTGITTIKSFTSEDYETERIRQLSHEYSRTNRRAIALSAAFVPLIRIIILVGFTAILLLGGLDAAAGTLAVGTYSTMVFLTQRLLWPLTRLGETLDLYQRSQASTRRLFKLLDTPIASYPGSKSLPIEQVKGEIILDSVTFAYQERQPIITNFSLSVPAGETIAIVGATGSGKSTIVKLLLRLYEIKSGHITLDGLDIQDILLSDLRRAIGLVSQDVFLFHGTVAENIRYGSFEASDEDIVAAATIAEAHGFIQELPQGYQTIIGERGQKLSGGQRQRLAIARAVLKNPPILILDEATSAVDNETEAAIQRSLEHITQNRTTIAIAHRLSTIRNADCIYVMDRGEIVEQGSHEHLLQQSGIYANLWTVQMGELLQH